VRAYVVSVRGEVPADIGTRVSNWHAAAIEDAIQKNTAGNQPTVFVPEVDSRDVEPAPAV